LAISTLAVAVALRPVTLEATAVMVHVAAEPGAVNTPALEMVPQDEDQVTGWFAVKVLTLRACRRTESGVIVTEAGTIVTDVFAVCPLPSVAVAVMVHDPALAGPVKVPSLPIEPQLAIHVDATLEVK
jgi:hypothetical protein